MTKIITLALTMLIACDTNTTQADYEQTYQTMDVWEGTCQEDGTVALDYDIVVAIQVANADGMWNAAEWEETTQGVTVPYCGEYARIVYLR